jgi:hypothetical protein
LLTPMPGGVGAQGRITGYTIRWPRSGADTPPTCRPGASRLLWSAHFRPSGRDAEPALHRRCPNRRWLGGGALQGIETAHARLDR